MPAVEDVVDCHRTLIVLTHETASMQRCDLCQILQHQHVNPAWALTPGACYEYDTP